MKFELPHSKIVQLGIVGVALFSYALLPFQSFASSNISLSPSSGSHQGSLSVDVVVNNTGDYVVGYDIDVQYSGAISFKSGSAGNLGCEPVIKESSSGKVNILCLVSLSQSDVGLNKSGTMARLNFTISGNGNATLQVNVNDSDGDIGSVTGGAYQVMAGGVGGGGGGAVLPQTSFITDYPIVAGGLLLSIGAGMLYVFRRYDSLNTTEVLYTKSSMKDKVSNV